MPVVIRIEQVRTPLDTKPLKWIWMAGLLASGFAAAQSLPANASREIGQLFTALENSGCQFSRNGSWHDAAQASAHLHRKYDYLLKKGKISSAETFIALAASNSSLSGQPYQVRCGQAPVVSCQTWFMARLRALRAR